MKVYINPTFDKPDTGDGGIRRCVEAQLKYLPDYGVEIVKDLLDADVANCHATSIVNHPNLVLSCHGLYWSEDNWGAKWALDANRDIINGMRRASVVTVPSRWVANVLQRGMLLDPVVVNHGVDLDEWKVGDPLGYVLWNKNRHDPSCDSSVVNTLASLVPNTIFRTTYGKQTDNVQVIGRLPYKDMKRIISGTSVYLATAKETFGVGIIEAMASGVPVLSWNWGGQAEILTHKVNGYLVDPGNYDDMVDGLHYCLEHREEMGKAARQTVVDRYQWNHVVGQYVTAYEAALNKNYPVKVSVVITAFNLAEYLPQAIQSVLNQTFSDWELIIVDDASTDNTVEIATSFAETDSRIRVVRNAVNQHVSESRNIGISLARGEYVIPLDADDRLNEDALKRLSRALDRDPGVHIATGAMQVFNPDGKSFVSGWPPPNPGYENQIAKQNQLPYASMYRKSVWERTGGYRRRIHSGVEDADFWTRALSYGFRAENIGEYPTLLYTMRVDSLSHTKKGEDFMSWFTWARHSDLTPFAAKDGSKIRSLNPAMISVIIPVGPEHDVYLQDCLDSLVFQTFQNWEVIVVNDTGQSWYENGQLINPYLAGFPFVMVLDSDTNHGTAYARNRGIEQANAPLIAFLDCDDYAQPYWLEALYKVYKTAGGWIYTDWYADNGADVYHDTAKDWNAESLTSKAIGPITGLYEKNHLLAVGGFDESIAGWEDWDLHLSLLEKGICGTRIAHPLFTYRYRTGLNRDKDFANKNDLLKYIRDKHVDIYKKGAIMGCSSCGGTPTVRINTSGVTKKTAPKQDLVNMKYVGPQTGVFHMKSHTHLGEKYTIERDHVFPVFKDELYRFLDLSVFVLAPEEVAVQSGELAVIEDKPIKVETTVKPTSATVDSLDLAHEIKTILKRNGLRTVGQLTLASDALLLSIPSIGESRVKKIREALANVT
jgi:glycosyltransferase involved in cell wall biosynthesis